MPEPKRPYSQVADFADLPSALHYLWHTFHFLPNSFADLRTQQVLTSDCIKSSLLLSVNSAKQPVEDFCFNLTCRLCYSKFKSLKTTNTALLAYICYVFTKIQSAPKTIHSAVDETLLLGRFPLPSRQVIESCLQFYETRPKALVIQAAPSRTDGNLQVLQSTSCFNPFPREQGSPKSVGASLGASSLYQRPRLTSNTVLNKYSADLSHEDDFAAQSAFNNLGTPLVRPAQLPVPCLGVNPRPSAIPEVSAHRVLVPQEALIAPMPSPHSQSDPDPDQDPRLHHKIPNPSPVLLFLSSLPPTTSPWQFSLSC